MGYDGNEIHFPNSVIHPFPPLPRLACMRMHVELGLVWLMFSGIFKLRRSVAVRWFRIRFVMECDRRHWSDLADKVKENYSSKRMVQKRSRQINKKSKTKWKRPHIKYSLLMSTVCSCFTAWKSYIS